jgi:hypothetical protein
VIVASVLKIFVALIMTTVNGNAQIARVKMEIEIAKIVIFLVSVGIAIFIITR